MKKLISGSKKAVAVFLLALLVVCAAAPSVQAGYSFVKSGARDGRTNDWYSKTTVSAYDEKGAAAKATAGASMPDTMWSYQTRTTTAYVESAHTATQGNAKHSYGVNGRILGEWTEN